MINQAENTNHLHQQALDISNRYRKNEADLLEIICLIDEKKVFRSFGYNSLFTYCTGALKLSEGTTYNLIGVARKSKVVPELKFAVSSGDLSLSKASKIISVITAQNKTQWIKQAKELPRLALEKEVARVNPKAAIPESATYVSDKRIALKLGVSEKLYKDLKRIQDLESKRQKHFVSFEDLLEILIPAYLEINDPVIKAEKAEVKRATKAKKGQNTKTEADVTESTESIGSTTQSKIFLATENENNSSREEFKNIPFTRYPIPVALKRQVLIRDRDHCQKCSNPRFTELHHIIPISHGGANELANLRTLCSACHKMEHWKDIAPNENSISN